MIALALVLGTAAHFFRPDAQKKIEWIKYYPNPLGLAPKKTSVDTEPKKIVQEAKKSSEQTKKPAEAAKKSVEEPKKFVETEGIREISVDDAILEHQNGTPFLDARRTRQFNEGHIPGASSVSVWESNLDGRIADLFDKIPFDTPVVLYCSSGDCEDSHSLATNMKAAGYKDLRIMRGGFPEWVKKSQPVEKGENQAGGSPSSEEEEK